MLATFINATRCRQNLKKKHSADLMKQRPTLTVHHSYIHIFFWHIKHCRLFNTKSSLYIYIKYIGFGLVRFYGISTIVGYLMPNPLYTYTKYIICKHILLITLLNEHELFFLRTFECSSMTRETWVQSQGEPYQRLEKWYLMLPCLILSIIRYGSRVKWGNPGKGVAPSPTPWCSCYRKGSLRINLDCGQLNGIIYCYGIVTI